MIYLFDRILVQRDKSFKAGLVRIKPPKTLKDCKNRKQRKAFARMQKLKTESRISQ